MHINEAQAFLSSRSCLGTFWRKCCQCSGGVWHWLSTHGGPQRNNLTRRLMHSFLRLSFWAFKRASYRRSISGLLTNTNVLILLMDLVSHDYLSAVTMLIILTHCGLFDVTWRQGSRSTFDRVMACCLTAPSHCLNQFWLIISKV